MEGGSAADEMDGPAWAAGRHHKRNPPDGKLSGHAGRLYRVGGFPQNARFGGIEPASIMQWKRQ